MTKPLRILIVEDREDDAELLVRFLERGGYAVTFERVETAESMRRALQKKWDFVISDYSMPAFNALNALAELKATGLDIPFLVISGTIGEETAIDALKAGANDFLVKGRLARLLPAIERERREADEREQRRIAEEALRKSDLRYRRIVETTREGIWMLDADARTTFVNRRLAEMVDSTPSAMIGTSVFDFLDEEGAALAARLLEKCEGGKEEKQEVHFRRKSGTEFWAHLSTNPIIDESGLYAGALAMVTDITEQRKMQAQLMVSDRMASVGTLAAGVAHEINNPLAAVIGNLDLALRDVSELAKKIDPHPELEDLQNGLREARESADRVRLIVRDLKIFSRIEEEETRPVDIQRVLESTLRMAWNEIRHRARLVKDYQRVPVVDGNESRLGQVFLNLVVNAAQAIPEGRANTNEIRVSTAFEGGRVVVEVRDTGTGISAEALPRLFTPFFTTKAIGVGTGLGLSICHRIVHSLGGEITVESQVGKGTAFRVLLPPANNETKVPVVPRQSSEPPSSRRGRILIVDDEPSVARALERILAKEHDMTIMSSARDALQYVADGKQFDVILCDLMMPDMSGMDLYAELTHAVPAQAAQMIFLTGGAFTPKARSFLDEIPNQRIEKPFDANSLRALIRYRIR